MSSLFKGTQERWGPPSRTPPPPQIVLPSPPGAPSPSPGHMGLINMPVLSDMDTCRLMLAAITCPRPTSTMLLLHRLAAAARGAGGGGGGLITTSFFVAVVSGME